MTGSVATEQNLELDIYVEEASWVGQFDSLDVWRSRSGPSGPYESLTGDAWGPARLPDVAGSAPVVPQDGPSAVLDGKTLALRVNEEIDLTVTFSGMGPMTFGQAAAQIVTQGGGLLRSFVIGSSLVIETLQPGSGAILRVVGGEAAPLLRLETDSVAFGLDARIPLVSGQTRYQFLDHNGSSEFFYKTRFYNNALTSTSVFSAPFSGRSVAALATSNLVRATVDLVDATGVAMARRAVIVSPQFRGSRVEGKTVIDSRLQMLTDDDGHAEFLLVRDQAFTVAIAGTPLVRDFTTPTDPAVTTFDMLDPAYGHDDVFDVQVPDVDFAVRRTL